MTILSQLIRLQDIDSQLMELDYLKGDLPAKVEELAGEVTHLEASIGQNADRLREIELETRRIEGSIREDNAKVDKLRDQLYLVKTNREYDALMAEIDHLRAQTDEAEIKELELSDEKDRLEERLKMDKLRLEERSEELESQQERLDKMIGSTEKELLELEEKREELVPTIDARHMGLYDRIRRARDGLAVVPVVNGACGGCHYTLTSQAVAEIRSRNKVISCPACRRFLYWQQN